MGRKKLTLNEFIQKSFLIHGNRYDYSDVNYKTNKIPVNIICKIHGVFGIRPDSHLNGQGCKCCGVEIRSKNATKSFESFVMDARKIHKNDYAYLFYKNRKEKMEIKCNKCNFVFFQTPYNHLSNNQGCPKCAGNQKSNTNEFIQKSKKIHNNKYDYSLVKYENCSKKVNINCNICGSGFHQTPNTHLLGHGCPHCSKTYPIGNEMFIEHSKKIHGDKYDYSFVNYINNTTPIKILCKKCKNIFEQKPVHHKNGSDCPICSRRRYSSKIERKFFRDLNINIKKQKPIGLYIVDGFDQKTNTIYEFLGDYWHGNPKIFSHMTTNPSTKKSHRELYLSTIDRFKKLKSLGYKIRYIWESDYKLGGTNLIKEYSYGRI